MVVLVRFGEIALKSRFVRRQFTDALVSNIQEAFIAAGRECITSRDEGRIYVRANDEEAAVRILARVFGIVSVSRAVEAEADLDAICKEGVALASLFISRGTSFAVRARRAGTHPYTSQDVAVALGSAVQDAVEGATVDLSHPDVELYVEVRGARAYLFTDRVKGPGGLPLGTQGKVVALLHTPRDAVAAWLMMKRGCRVVVSSETDGPEVEALERWDPNLEVVPTAPDGRMAADQLMGAEVLVTGADVSEAGKETGPLPIFHPTVGLSPDDVNELWKAISSESESHEET